METRLTVSGHPVHPILMTLPLGLFICGVIFDLGGLASGMAFLGAVGYWTIVAGLFAALLAIGAGMVDLWDVASGPEKTLAVTYQAANLGMVGLFLVSCLIRAGTDRAASPGAFLLELLALASGALGAWLGVRMVRHHHLGIEPEPDTDPPFEPTGPLRLTVRASRPPT
jgi:uncharacterized membrane protein